MPPLVGHELEPQGKPSFILIFSIDHLLTLIILHFCPSSSHVQNSNHIVDIGKKRHEKIISSISTNFISNSAQLDSSIEVLIMLQRDPEFLS